jgi:hypothetical protein
MPSESVDVNVGQLTFLLVLLGFFPIVVLLGVGAIFLATLWVAFQ